MDKLIAKAMRGMKIMIAIKGMDMPANCGECPLTYPVGFYRNLPFSVDKSKGCCILVCEIEDPNIRLPDCPLIEIKDGEEKMNQLFISVTVLWMIACIVMSTISK